MSIFGGARSKLRRAEKKSTISDASSVVRESKELRHQIARDMMSPARATVGQISTRMTHIDRQLVQLEKLRGTVTENRTKYAVAKAETDNLRAQREGLRQMKKAEKKQKALSPGKRRKLLGII